MRPLVSFIKEISVLFLFQLVVVFYIISCYVCVFYIREIVLVNFTNIDNCVPVFEFDCVFLVSFQLNSNMQVVVLCHFLDGC